MADATQRRIVRPKPSDYTEQELAMQPIDYLPGSRIPLFNSMNRARIEASNAVYKRTGRRDLIRPEEV